MKRKNKIICGLINRVEIGHILVTCSEYRKKLDTKCYIYKN
jgi:hypothetical protein